MTQQYAPKYINTRRFQMAHLAQFMFTEHGAFFDGVRFSGAGQSISFNEAVRQYNEAEDKEGYAIEQLKLHYCKKEKRIVCQSHLVKFTEGFKQDCEGADPADVMRVIIGRECLQ